MFDELTKPPQDTPPAFIQELKDLRVVYEGFMTGAGPALRVLNWVEADNGN